MRIRKIVYWLLAPNKHKYLVYSLLNACFSCFIYLYFNSFILAAAGLAAGAILLEITFRLSYRYIHQRGLPERFSLHSEDIPIEEHPYLPWVYKKNYRPPLGGKKIYSDERQGFMLGGLATNNIRHVNGYDGSRDVIMPKPESLFRILCLGDSTTCNYVKNEDGSYISWPLKLEEKLSQDNKTIEVINCGQGGYNTNEIIIKFLIDTIDTQPDVIILYHAFTNIRGYLTQEFERDFYHFRRTMSQSYPLRVRVARCVPTFGLEFIQFIVGEYLSYLNIKYDHINQINRYNNIDRLKTPEGLETYYRNIENLIHICRGRGIQLVLSTYCYNLHDRIRHSEIHKKFCQIVKQENEMMISLSRKFDIPLVDMAERMPINDDYFLDEVHPNEAGMSLIADNFYSTLTKILKRK